MITEKGYTAQHLRRWTELHTCNHHTYIILEDEHNNFWGIRKEWIKDGHLTKALNGITGNMAEDMSECIRRCESDSDYRHCVELGMSEDEIIDHIMKQAQNAM